MASTSARPVLLEAVLTLNASSAPGLGPDMDEAYTLQVPADGTPAGVEARSVHGAMRGLESLLQLVNFTTPSMPAPVAIDDAPQFAYRGLMVDTGRHFLPPELLRKLIDGLAATKMNVLHWHITDEESFPLRLRGFEDLADMGAYARGAVYTEADVLALVEYAAERGVRIIPEIDIPAHSSFGRARPSLTTATCRGTLDPTSDATYAFLAAFLSRVVALFPDPYLMLGGDEVNAHCFSRDANISAWMAAHGYNGSTLQNHFWRRVQRDVMPALPQRRTLYLWMSDDPNAASTEPGKTVSHPMSLDVLDANTTVLNVYQRMSRANTTLAAGFGTTLSIGWQNASNPFGLGWYLPRLAPWERRYTRLPCVELHCDARTRRLLLGGETCAWGTVINKASPHPHPHPQPDTLVTS